MKKSAIQSMPVYFDRYINLVDDVELKDAFSKSLRQLEALSPEQLKAVGDAVYAPGKWAIHDILQHIIDAERIFTYRALRFARNDSTRLPGFDQELFAANAAADKRKIAELLDELKMVRKSIMTLYSSFNDTMLQREGFCYKGDISVLAIGFTVIGHQMHHLKIIEEKYLPLAK